MKRATMIKTAQGAMKRAVLGLAAAVVMGAGLGAHAELVGRWVSGAQSLSETSGYRVAGTHDGVAIGGNAGLLAYSSDVPAGFEGKSLDLTAGNVGVSINKSASTDTGYVNTYDDVIHSQFTVAFWAKGFPTTWNPWVAKGGENNIGWQVRRMENDPVAGFTMRGIDNDDGRGSPINVNNANWHHFAGVWSQATGTRTLYVDGVFSHTVSNNPSELMTLAPGSHLGLGARQVASGGGYDGYFAGKLFDVRIYNTVLSQSDVLLLIPPPMPAGLLATPGNAKVGLLWTPSLGATSYTVWTKNNTTLVEQTDTTTTANFSKTGLDNGTLYTFKVLATNSVGTSAYTAEVSATPAWARPRTFSPSASPAWAPPRLPAPTSSRMFRSARM